MARIAAQEAGRGLGGRVDGAGLRGPDGGRLGPAGTLGSAGSTPRGGRSGRSSRTRPWPGSRRHPEVTSIQGDYWDVYRLSFLTGGRVRGMPFPEYPERFPEIARACRAVGRGS